MTDAQTCPCDTVDGHSTYAPVSTAASTLAEQNYPYVAAQFVSIRWLQEHYPLHEVWFDCVLQGLHSVPAAADQGKTYCICGNQSLKCSKAVPLQAWSGPEDSRKLRFPGFMTTVQDGWQGCQPCAPATFTSRKYTWYSFVLEAELTPGP